MPGWRLAGSGSGSAALLLQENMPGSNEFADQGANPIWQVAQESNDFDEHFK